MRARLEQHDLDVIVGSHEGPWRKGVAVADALTRTDADVLVVSDADVVCDDLPDAIAAVVAGAAWAVPHTRVRRLTTAATDQVLAGAIPHGPLEERPYRGILGGGIVVLPRDVYVEAPIDPRFVGWGQEDESWGLALSNRYGWPVRGSGDLWHLWHPPQPRTSRGVGSAESLDLFRQYVKNPDAALLEARRYLKNERDVI